MADGSTDCYYFSQILFVLDDDDYVASKDSRDYTRIQENEKYVADAQTGEIQKGNLRMEQKATCRPLARGNGKEETIGKRHSLKHGTEDGLEQNQEDAEKSKQEQDKSTNTPKKIKETVHKFLLEYVAPTKDKLGLMGILNTLDGVLDSPGRFLIINSANPAYLDAAIIRKGRIDRHFDLKPLSPECFIEMAENYLQSEMSEEEIKRAQRVANTLNWACAELEQYIML
eukprot:Filipodium_phascolosomae@DN5814_c0_g1_i1.p1